MIQLDGVGKTFRIAPGPGRRGGTVVAVRGLTLLIAPGEVVGVVGPNGAGKTTLFGLLLGFLEATTGSITIHGMEPRRYVRKHGANYLPERFQLPREWTLRAALQGLLKLDGSARPVDDVLAEYDLTAFADAAAHTLSRGTLQRVGVAQALATPRDLVVLDEPTEGLDPLWRVRFRETVLGLRAASRAVLIASHDLNEIERVADRVVIMKAGAITEEITLHHDAATARDYTLVLAAPHDSVAAIFAHAVATGGSSYVVAVTDTIDLNARLAALIDAGAQVVSLTPAVGLEERVTRAMSPDRDAGAT